MAYFDGELPPDRAAAVEARLHLDPAARVRFGGWRKVGDITRGKSDHLYRNADGIADDVMRAVRRGQGRPLAKKPRRAAVVWASVGGALALAASAIVYNASTVSIRHASVPVGNLAKPAARPPGHDLAGGGVEQASRTASPAASSSVRVEDLQVEEGDTVIYGAGIAGAPPVVWIRGEGAKQP